MEEFLFADQLRAFAKQVKEATTSFEAFTLPVSPIFFLAADEVADNFGRTLQSATFVKMNRP